MKSGKTLSTMLIEDEIQTRDLITSWIAEHESLKLSGVAYNGADGLEKLKKGGIDLVFLDIDLPVMSGLEILEELEEIPYVIFITVSEQYALKAFEIGALDYLHKPFSRERFMKAVDRAVEFINNRSGENKEFATRGLIIAEGENHYLVPFREIIYLTGHDKHTIIHTERKDYESNKTLQSVGEKLPSTQFLRIHKQNILNIDYISHTQYLIGGRYQVFLKDSDETSLTVGRKFANDFKKILGL